MKSAVSAGPYQVSMKNPIGMEIVDSIKDLVEERFDHSVGNNCLWLLPHFNCPVVLDDVLEKR